MPFKKKTPSLFFINSPFQALCMLEAIEEFEIDDYKVYLVLYDDTRNAQLITLLNNNDVRYEIIEGSKNCFWNYLTLFLSLRWNRYKRSFIGHYNTDSFFYYALKYASCRSDIVYLDDGAATISLLNNTFRRSFGGGLVFVLFRVVAFIKCISLNNLYTIYSGITNNKFDIHICNFKRLAALSSGSQKGGVIIIGTNSSIYCRVNSLSECDYKLFLDSQFDSIRRKYPNEKISYVPHGRDVSSIPKNLCKKYNFEFKRVDSTVEIYVLSSVYIPIAIYGFTSSALFNLKKMIPSCDVFNIVLGSSNVGKMDTRLDKISDYYETIGIVKVNR